ncbi:MAG: hypothetical protein WCP38_03215 [Chloroflexota bacterium]
MITKDDILIAEAYGQMQAPQAGTQQPSAATPKYTPPSITGPTLQQQGKAAVPNAVQQDGGVLATVNIPAGQLLLSKNYNMYRSSTAAASSQGALQAQLIGSYKSQPQGWMFTTAAGLKFIVDIDGIYQAGDAGPQYALQVFANENKSVFVL